MKYNVGQTVKIKTREELEKITSVNEEMLQYADKTAIIVSVISNIGGLYKINIDCSKYYWEKNCFTKTES